MAPRRAIPETTMSDPASYAAAVAAGLKDVATRLIEDAPAEGLEGALESLPPAAEPLRAIAPKKAVLVALFRDALRLADLAIRADGRASPAEWRLVAPLVRSLGRALAAEFPQTLGVYQDVSPDQAGAFLDALRQETNLPGWAAPVPELLGHWLCREVVARGGDPALLDAYERTALRIVDDVMGLDGISESEARVRHELRRFMWRGAADGKPVSAPGTEPEAPIDPRIRAFCDPQGPDVFAPTADARSAWEPDPFDVPAIHAEAREVFATSVSRVLSRPEHGRALVVLGQSGSGKTHLMRAFRAHLHEEQRGIGCILQLSSGADDYARYVLRNLLPALERPYDPPLNPQSGLMLLSNATTTHRGMLRPDGIETLRQASLSESELATLVDQLAERLSDHSSLAGFDLDSIRAMLLLQRREPSLQQKVVSYLRCEPQPAGLPSIRSGDSPPEPAVMLSQLSRLVTVTGLGTLLIVLDQLEEMFSLDDSRGDFQRAMATVKTLLDTAPHTMVVVACLDDFWNEHRKALDPSVLERLEAEPRPVRLGWSRSRSEVEAMISVRLEHLYESAGVRFRPDEPGFPYTAEHLDALENLRTRDVLAWCREHHAACRAAGHWVEPPAVRAGGPRPPHEHELAQRWNDFRTDFDAPLPFGDDGALAAAIAAGLEGLGWRARVDGRFVEIDGPEGSLLAAICNEDARTDRLEAQVRAARQRAGDRTCVLVRGTDFSSDPRHPVYRQIGEVVADGGRQVVVTDGDVRAMAAYRAFEAAHAEHPGFARWVAQMDPLGRVPLLEAVVGRSPARPILPETPKSDLETAGAPAATVDPEPAPLRSPAAADPVEPAFGGPPAPVEQAADGPHRTAVRLGRTRALQPEPVQIEPEELLQHAAFLAAPGSGKTTLALRVLEQLAGQGVPVLMVDRKGDLAAYAEPERWAGLDPQATQAATRLREGVGVSLYTPGEPRGRPVGFPLIPRGLAELSDHERAFVTKRAASALGAMLDLGRAQSGPMLTILAQALRVLGELSDHPEQLGLQDLVGFIDSQDPSLAHAVGRIDMRHARRLVEALEVLRIQHGHLMEPTAPFFDPEAALGDPGPGRTPISIVSTRFLPDTGVVDAWVARLLLEVGRWAAGRPARGLQAAVFLDEADLYLPGHRKTAVKDVVMDFLRRARSAGIAVLLASQNPGEFDYRARDQVDHWFLGRTSDPRDLDRMRPVLSMAPTDLAAKLPGASLGEFFWVREGRSTELRSDLSFVRVERLSDPRIRELSVAEPPS